MPIGIGGIGDILAIIGLVREFASALNDSRGSAADYQEVRRELDGLERALLCLHQLLQARIHDPALNAIFISTQSTAEDCQRCIQAFSQQIVKFDGTLGVGKQSNVAREITMKVRWQMSRKDEVARFRTILGQHISSLNMLFALANINMQRETHEKLDTKLDDLKAKIDTKSKDLEDKVDANAKAQENTIAELQNSVEQYNTQTGHALTDIRESLKLGWLRQLGTEIKGMVSGIFTISGTTLSAVQRIEERLPIQDMTLNRAFTLEDALGRTTRIDMIFVSSWDAFDAMLEGCFRDFPGHKMVEKKQYIFQDQKTNREIKRTMPWSGALVPGQLIYMGLLFKRRSLKDRSFCPYCHLVLVQSQDELIPCKCGMSHHRRTEKMDIIGEENMPIFDLPDAPTGKLNDATETVKEDQVDEWAQGSHLSTLVDNTAYEDISLFKRVIVVEIEMNIIKSKKKAKGKKNQRRRLDSDEEELQPSSGSSVGYAGYGSTYTPSGMYAQPRYTATSYYGSTANQRTRTRNATSNRSEYQYSYAHDPDPVYENYRMADRNEAYYAFSRPGQSDYKRRSHTNEYVSYESRESKANNNYYQPRSGTNYYQEQNSPYYSTPPAGCRNATSSPTPERPRTRRPSSPKSPTSSKKSTPPLTTKAIEADARKHRIPPGYSLKHWDPSEVPITLLGSVFDGNSLGKWIYDWTVYTHGPATPLADMAGELWLLLLQLIGKTKRAEECMPKIRNRDRKEMVEDFIDSGERLFEKVQKLLRTCEGPMLKHSKRQVEETFVVKADLQSSNTMSSEPREPKLGVTQSEKINTEEHMPEASKQEDIKSEDVILEEIGTKMAEPAEVPSQDVITNDATTSQEVSTTEEITKGDDQPTASSSIMVNSSVDEDTKTPSRATRKYLKDATLKKNAGIEFVNTIFGRDQQLAVTEKLMSSLRLWSLRFDANCEEILKNPGEP